MAIQEQLNQYYKCVGIAPVVPKDVDITPVDSVEDRRKKMFCAFCCEKKKKEACKEACKEAYEKNFSTTKGFLPETLAMVRSLLYPFIASDVPEPATYPEDESRKEIEKLFVHVRAAKCCSNADGPRQEPPTVYKNCGGYLGEELSILKPDVIVTQGNNAHREAKRHAFEENGIKISVEKVTGIETKSIARIVQLKEGNQRVYWLRSYFPTYWGFYSLHAGKKIGSESNVVGAKREHFVRYGKVIKKFIKDR